jgi:hypothetical protein
MCKYCGFCPADNKLVIRDLSQPIDLEGQMYLFGDDETDDRGECSNKNEQIHGADCDCSGKLIGGFVGDRCPTKGCVDKRTGQQNEIGVYSIHRKVRGFVTRFLKCKYCGFRSADNKLVMPDLEKCKYTNGQKFLFGEDEDPSR